MSTPTQKKRNNNNKRGFSLNKTILEVNICEESIVARKVISKQSSPLYSRYDSKQRSPLYSRYDSKQPSPLYSRYHMSAHLKYKTNLDEVAAHKIHEEISNQELLINTEIIVQEIVTFFAPMSYKRLDVIFLLG